MIGAMQARIKRGVRELRAGRILKGESCVKFVEASRLLQHGSGLACSPTGLVVVHLVTRIRKE